MRIGRVGFAVGVLPVLGALYACDHFNIGFTDGEPNTLKVAVLLFSSPMWFLFLTVLRCHDFNESAWTNYFIDQVPIIGQIWATAELFLKPGSRGYNRYGGPPLF